MSSDNISNPEAALAFEEAPTFFREHYLGVSSAVKATHVSPNFRHNEDLARQIPGWPDKINPKDFCFFSVPNRSKSTTDKSTHLGMGRSISSLHFPMPSSPLAGELRSGSQKMRPGLIGIHDETTGMFYTNIGIKGTGPSSIEMAKVMGLHLGAGDRQKSHEPWGIVTEETARRVEQNFLEKLASIGFRVGRVPLHFGLDKAKLAALVDPYYQEAGLGGTYDIKRELKKVTLDPAIMVRLTGGVRTDVFLNRNADPALAEEAIFAVTGEIARGGLENFIKRYTIHDDLAPALEQLASYDFARPFEKKDKESILNTISFLMWRNYHLQDEYNERFPLSPIILANLLREYGSELSIPSHPVGPVWLNYKPGDWDVSGFMFDMDTFLFKLNHALSVGVNEARRIDAYAVSSGLEFIADKILPGEGRRIIDSGKTSAQQVHQRNGFLKKDVSEQLFYTM